MADNFFKTVDNQSRTDVINSMVKPSVSRSVFPYGRSSILNMNEGYIYVVDCFMTLPHDSIDIDFASYLESLNPFAQRQYSGMKLCFHVFYNKCEHEWKGWKTFATKGIRGNINQILPYVKTNDISYTCFDGEVLLDIASQPMECKHDLDSSLSAFLVGHCVKGASNQTAILVDSSQTTLRDEFGCGDNTQVNRSYRIGIEYVDSINGILDAHYNAIPFSMYQRVFRKFYLNQNFVKDNKWWFPDDDDDFVLPYNGGKVSIVNVSQPSRPLFSLVPNNYTDFNTIGTGHLTGMADMPLLAQMRCRQYFGDSFTTSTSFLERNGSTLLQSPIRSLQSSLLPDSPSVFQMADLGTKIPQDWLNPESLSSPNGTTPISSTQYKDNLVYTQINGGYIVRSVLSLNELRELSAATLWSERNAKSKGDYNSLIESHYAWDPSSEDREPLYLGGSVQRINFDNVISQTETATQPLGTLTSRASSGGQASIPHFESPDFGYVMITASLVPDTYYANGLREEFDPTLMSSDLPWPEFANLQKENVLLKRLYYTGNSSLDNRLIGYNERFLNWKYRPNVILGRFLNPNDLKFRAMTFARYIDSVSSISSINNEFVTCSPYNCRSDMYSVPSQPHFVLQFGDNVRVVRSLPYAAKESALTNIA